MGSQTRVVPWGKTISTRVVTSNVRHLTVGRGSNAPCANESFGNAAAAGRIAPLFRNARLSMSVLRSIEALTDATRARASRRTEYPVSVAANGLRLGRRSCRRAKGERGSRAAAVDIAVATPSSARARGLREPDHHCERTRAA